MLYTASPTTIGALVELLIQAQPSWKPGLVRIILDSHASHVHGNDLAIAALRYADSDMALKIGPKGIGWRGPHWRDLGSKPPEVKDVQWCGICTKPEWRCLTERIGQDDDHEFEPTDRPPRARR